MKKNVIVITGHELTPEERKIILKTIQVVDYVSD